MNMKLKEKNRLTRLVVSYNKSQTYHFVFAHLNTVMIINDGRT